MVGGGRTAMQASHVFSYLQRWRGQSAQNPWWPQYFWQDVCKMVVASGIEPDLLCVLRAAGYAGAGTVTVPVESLQTVLEISVVISDSRLQRQM